MSDRTFFFADNSISLPENEQFYLHNHDMYEIFVFLKGDSSFFIEGSNFELAPYDVLFICPDEMHRVWHNSEKSVYSRLIFNVSHLYFEKYNMTKYENILKQNSAKHRKISGKSNYSNGIKEIIEKIKKCMENGEDSDSAIINAYFIELIYTMCNVAEFDSTGAANSKVQAAIDYINENFKKHITLDDVSKNVFVSKHHLCRMFKEMTGYTVNGYLNHRRIMFVNDCVHRKNMTIQDACFDAGFTNYANFYRMYKKENSISPAKGLKRHLKPSTSEATYTVKLV